MDTNIDGQAPQQPPIAPTSSWGDAIGATLKGPNRIKTSAPPPTDPPGRPSPVDEVSEIDVAAGLKNFSEIAMAVFAYNIKANASPPPILEKSQHSRQSSDQGLGTLEAAISPAQIQKMIDDNYGAIIASEADAATMRMGR